MENRLDVLITCFNHEKSIGKSINSVLNQKTFDLLKYYVLMIFHQIEV